MKGEEIQEQVTAQMGEALKPCPFCGGKAEWVRTGFEGRSFQGWCIRCTQCGAESNARYGHEDYDPVLLTRWNTRPEYESDRLKLCPFCKGKAYLFSSNSRYDGPGMKDVWHAQCGDCSAHTVWMPDIESAVEAWNRRT